MVYTISTNDGTGKPVKGATITFARNGAIFNAVDFPDNTGVLYFDSVSDADLFQSDVSIRVTASGYNTAGTTGNAIHGDWVFTLRNNGFEKAGLIGAGVAALLVAGASVNNKANRKVKKVSGIDVKKDVLPWLPLVAVGVGGYLLYEMFLAKSPEDKARDNALSDDIDYYAAIEPPRMSDSEIATTANALVEDLTYSHPFGDSDMQLDAAHQLTKPGTTADLLRLIKQYGKHAITYFGIPAGTFTLEETVTRKLDASTIAEINAYYKAQGIAFQF